MSEKSLKRTEGQYIGSITVSLCNDIDTHKIHKHVSSKWGARLYVATHSLQEAKAELQ